MLVEQGLEFGETLGPEGAVMGEPVGEWGEAFGTGLVDGAAAFAAMGDESATAEDGEMLRDSGLRDGKTFGEGVDGGFATGEVFEDGEAGGIGEGLEDGGLAFVRHG